MILKIIAKNEKGVEGLREVIKDSHSRKAKMFYKVVIIEKDPFTINFEFTKLATKLGDNQTIRNTIMNGLKEQLDHEHNLTENEIEVKF